MRMDDRDLWLAARLVELAESADADCGEAACTELVTASVAELLAPSEIGILLTGASGGVTVAAASSERARGLISFEAAHQEGPASDCCSSGEQLLNAPLVSSASRWPGFAAAADAAGAAVVSAFPLRCRAHAVGAISVLGLGMGCSPSPTPTGCSSSPGQPRSPSHSSARSGEARWPLVSFSTR